jgi:hypothetical protein
MKLNPNQTRTLGNTCSVALVVLVGALLVLTTASGCNTLKELPPGTQLQSSTFGVRIAPQAPDGTPLSLGSHTTIITTAQPADAGVNLNRFEGSAPGVNVRSTVASGEIGEQIDKAGGADALRALMDRTGTNAASPETTLGEPEPKQDTGT